MSGFRTHLHVGIKLHVAATVVTGATYVASLVGEVHLLAVAACLPVTVAGALFPDIDHHASIPTRLLHRFGPWVAATLLAVLAVANARSLVTQAAVTRPMLDPGYLAGAGSAAAVAVAFLGVRWAIPRLRPSHRGPTHRVPVGLAMSGLVGGASVVVALEMTAPWTIARVVGTATAVTFFIGVLGHLGVDDLLRRRETYTSLS